MFVLLFAISLSRSKKIREGGDEDTNSIFDQVYPYLVIADKFLGSSYKIVDFFNDIDMKGDKIFNDEMKKPYTNFTSQSFADAYYYYKIAHPDEPESEPPGTDPEVDDNENMFYYLGNTIMNYNRSTLIKDLMDTSILPTEKDIDDLFDVISGFVNALNLNADTVRAGLKNIAKNKDTITIYDSFKSLGFDYNNLFNLQENLGKVFEKGTNYPIQTFLRDHFFQPPSVVDQVVNALKSIFYDGNFTYKAVEDLFLSIVKFMSHIVQSIFSFALKIIGLVLAQLAPVIDFNARSLTTRVNDVIGSLDKMIIKFPEESKEYKAIKNNLVAANSEGVDVSDFFNDDQQALIRILQALTDKETSLFKVLIAAIPDSNISNIMNFLYVCVDVFANENGDLSDINNAIKKLPVKWNDIELRDLVQTIYNYIFVELPAELVTKPLIECSLIKMIEMSDVVNATLDMVVSISKEIWNTKDAKVWETFGFEKAADFKDLASFVASVTGASVDVIDFITDIAAEIGLMSKENATFTVKLLQKVLVSTLTTVSKIEENTVFPYTLLLPVVTEISGKLADFFSKSKIYVYDILKLFYEPLGIVTEIIYNIFKDINGDETIEAFLGKIPITFLNAKTTLERLAKFENGFSLTLIEIANAIVIGDIKIKMLKDGTVYSFDDILPIEHISRAAQATYNANQKHQKITTKFIAESVLEVKVTTITSAASSVNSIVNSEQSSLCSIIKVASSYDVSASFSSISSLASKVAKNEKITTNDIQDAVNKVVEDAKQKDNDAGPTPKSKLGAGPIAGIVIACLIVVAAIVGGAWYFMKNKYDSDRTTKDVTI